MPAALSKSASDIILLLQEGLLMIGSGERPVSGHSDWITTIMQCSTYCFTSGCSHKHSAPRVKDPRAVKMLPLHCTKALFEGEGGRRAADLEVRSLLL